MEDLSVPDKQQWESAAKFLEETIAKKLDEAMKEWSELTGPNFTQRWMSWKSTTPEQVRKIYHFTFSCVIYLMKMSLSLYFCNILLDVIP